jgi:hypothetical protein
MFAPDERDRIIADVREWAGKQPGWPSGKEAVWAAFINRVRDNLHVVLALSPVGEAFRARWAGRRQGRALARPSGCCCAAAAPAAGGAGRRRQASCGQGPGRAPSTHPTPCLAARRCRQFPSLINCTTIDWYSRWPQEALLSVAGRLLAGTELGGKQVRLVGSASRAAGGGHLLSLRRQGSSRKWELSYSTMRSTRHTRAWPPLAAA